MNPSRKHSCCHSCSTPAPPPRGGCLGGKVNDFVHTPLQMCDVWLTAIRFCYYS